MEFSQAAVPALHDFGTADPAAPTDRATVVVPMAGREAGSTAARRLFEGLAAVDPQEVLVPVRAPPDRAAALAAELDAVPVDTTVIYCSGPRVSELLADAGLDGATGKGHDCWLGVGAARGEYVAFHDADARSYEPRDTRKLLAPLDPDGPIARAAGAPDANARAVGDAGDASDGGDAGPGGPADARDEVPDDDSPFRFVKAYYARVEQGRLFGRLTRLFFDPLVATLAAGHDDALLEYLGAFRYALAGECAMPTALARSIPVERRWGFEVGTLAAAFDRVGPGGSVQVDLGRYEHDHRAVDGPGGLSDVSRGVGDALFRALAERPSAAAPDYDALRERYRETARRRVRAHAADAAFNDLAVDPAGEREQVERYAAAVNPPPDDDRLPPVETVLSADAIRTAAGADLESARDGTTDAVALAEDGPGD